MASDEVIINALRLAILLVLVLIYICWKNIKSIKTNPDTFANDKEKIDRAVEVINSVGEPMKKNPNMTFDESKGYMSSLDAVEYRDVKSTVKSGGSLTASNLASKW
jgi:hypothetical protein